MLSKRWITKCFQGKRRLFWFFRKLLFPVQIYDAGQNAPQPQTILNKIELGGAFRVVSVWAPETVRAEEMLDWNTRVPGQQKEIIDRWKGSPFLPMPPSGGRYAEFLRGIADLVSALFPPRAQKLRQIYQQHAQPLRRSLFAQVPQASRIAFPPHSPRIPPGFPPDVTPASGGESALPPFSNFGDLRFIGQGQFKRSAIRLEIKLTSDWKKSAIGPRAHSQAGACERAESSPSFLHRPGGSF